MRAPKACKRILRAEGAGRRARGRRLRRRADGLRGVAARFPRRSWRPTRTSGSPTGSPRRSPSACFWPSRSRAASGRSTASPAGRSRRETGRRSRAEARRVFDLPPRARVLLVFGGSQGARSLNDEIVEASARRGPPCCTCAASATSSGCAVASGATTTGWFRSRTNSALQSAAADLVVARAGGSVWEVAAAGKPAILVPYPFATADHQAKNARFFERAGAAITVPETELGRVADLARSLIGDPDRLKEMGDAMKRVAKPNAAEEIAEGLIELSVLRAAGSGSWGSGAPASRATPCSRRRGGQRSPAGTATRRRTSSTSAPPGSR